MKNFARPLMILILVAATAGSAFADWGYYGWKTVLQPVNTSADVVSATDGAGGMLLVMNDPGEPIFPISISRIDHTGNEVWGAGGKVIPVEVSSDGMTGPIDVVDDGVQGAYCIYTRLFGASQILYLTHVAADGTVDTNVPVGDFGPNPVPAASLVKSDNGDLLVSWNRSVGSMDLELITARLAPDGTSLWETTVWADNNNNLDQLNWVVNSDGYGGLVFGINYHSFGGLWEGHVQRLAGNGSLMWGSRGVQAFGSLGTVVEVLPDAAGGAYLMNSRGWGDTWVQHVDALGGETWVAGGVQVFNLNNWPNPSVPVFCVDGGGGFFAVDGIDDLYAQHVDVYGSLLWGTPGLQITTLAGWQDEPSLTPDGFGGALVVYEDHYYSEITDNNPHAVSAIRIDGFGGTVWENTAFWWAIYDTDPTDIIAYPQVVADGSGGALVHWDLFDSSRTTRTVLATGVGPEGSSPPVPVLTYITPDAGSVGDVQQAAVLGDYLDTSLTYYLTRPGASDMVLTGVTALSAQLVTGTLDLAPAQAGAYDLAAIRSGNVQATLANAYGVGEMVPCTQDEPMSLVENQPLPFGSQRRMAFDSQGRVNAMWLDWDFNGYGVVWQVEEPGGFETVEHIILTQEALRDPSFAMGPGDLACFVFVQEQSAQDYLTCIVRVPQGRDDTYSLFVPAGVHNPVVVVDGQGLAQIVYEEGAYGQTSLYQVTVGPAGFGVPTALNAGTNASLPDLTVDGTGLMLTFVRDFWWPGLREVCYQQFDGVNWAAPVGVYFGVSVISPSVAWDGVNKVLLSWVLDNTGSDPLLHTLLLDNHVAGPVRWRTGLPAVYRCSVAANGPDSFQLMTLESDNSLPLQVILRAGDGNVFYPRRRLNSTSDVDFPYFCADYGNMSVAAIWDEYGDPAAPLYRFTCISSGGVSAVELPAAAVSAAAFPNPFNPSTTIRFSQRREGWTRLAIYDVAGRRVRTLVDGIEGAGNHAVAWDGRDAEGRGLPSGVYFGRLQLPGGQAPAVIKLTMLK